MAGNTLQAMQIGLHVVGNNIANANTPGYVRERTIYSPAPVQKIGTLTLGLGVEIAGIVQNVDKFTESRLRDAVSDRTSAEVQEDIYRDLELAIGELTDVDISTALTKFFGSIALVHDTPEDIAIRNLAISDGATLAQRINTLDRRATTLYEDFTQRVDDITSEINTLTEQVRQLNLQIATAEGGGSSGSDAGALRSQRKLALQQLSEITNINVVEQASGAVNVSVNGDLLVFEGTRREVQTESINENGLTRTVIQYADNSGELVVSGGELHGIYEARDTVIDGFLGNLDEFASTLVFEFNKLYSQGEGIAGFNSLTTLDRVEDPSAALNATGLNFTPVSGVFQLNINNKEIDDPEAQAQIHDIFIDLNGTDGDTSLNSLAASINAIDGVSASVNFNNELVVTSDSEAIEFSFSGDTSGALAALGLNTFFTGSTARDIGVNQVLREDSTSGAKFAASGSGLGTGNEIALELMTLNDKSLGSLDGGSITGVYDQLINDTTQGATVSSAVADGLRVFEGTLAAEVAAVSGVNLDEEAIDMIMLQQTYQASARYISTLSEMLDIIVAL